MSIHFKKLFIIGIIIGLLAPIVINAQVKITEIMYDPEGSDTKREWIEVYNSGNTDIDLSTYFFFENNIYHKLVAQTSSIIAPGAYAIITDSIAEVLADYKDFIGLIFDSAFSLNNTGETISMTNSAKQIIDTVTYSSDMGANNDGNSLQINDEQIISATPTFGSQNKTVSEEPPSDSSDQTSSGSTSLTSGSSVSTHAQQEPVTNYNPTTSFKIGAGRSRTVSINTPIDFEAQISKADIKPRFVWNLGDFSIKKGNKITHTYNNEGIYEIILEGKKDGITAISRTEVSVVYPQIEIIQATSSIFVKNKAKSEINLGGFILKFMNRELIIPKNSIIKGGQMVKVPIYENEVFQSLVYPNGEIYTMFGTI